MITSPSFIMKKKLAYIFAILSLLFITAFIIYNIRYKQAFSLKNRIPNYSNAVIGVNLRNIESYFLIDFLKNPLSYTTKKSKENLYKELIAQLKIPSSILFHSTNQQWNTTWYSEKITIKNPQELQKTLQRIQFNKLIKNEITFYTKNQWCIGIHENQAIIAASTEDFKAIFTTITNFLTSVDFLTEENTLFQELLKIGTNDFFFANDSKSYAFGNFNKGNFNIHGVLHDNILQKSTRNLLKPSGNSAAFGYACFNKQHSLLQKIKLQKGIRLKGMSIDSIFNKWNGVLSFNIINIAQKTDSIINYEYDADFNKKKIVQLKQRFAPNFHTSLGQNDNELYLYLQRNNYISHQNTLKFAYSLPINIVDTPNKITFGTDMAIQHMNTLSSNLIAELYIDFKKSRILMNSPLKSIDFKLQNDSYFTASLYSNTNRNMLCQLLTY